MPRGGSRGRSGGSRSPPPRSSFTASRPSPAQTPPPRQMPAYQTGGGMMGGIGSTIMTGMAFGAGSEVAHQAVRGIMGNSPSQVQQHEAQQNLQYPPQQQYSQSQYQNPCQLQIQNFSNCLNTHDDVSACQNFSDILKQCKKDHNLA